jgi:hypothetical protein
MVTLPGTVIAGALLQRFTTAPPDGAGAASVTPPVVLVPPRIMPGVGSTPSADVRARPGSVLDSAASGAFEPGNDGSTGEGSGSTMHNLVQMGMPAMLVWLSQYDKGSASAVRIGVIQLRADSIRLATANEP